MKRESKMEFSKQALIKYVIFTLAGLLIISSLLSTNWILFLFTIVLTGLLLYRLKEKTDLYQGFVWLFDLWCKHEDGTEQLGPNQSWADFEPGEVGGETVRDLHEHPYNVYWLHNKNTDMIDMLALDRIVTNANISPQEDYLHTDIEWRAIGQFRTYFSKKKRQASQTDISTFLSELDSEFSGQIRKGQQKAKENKPRRMEIINPLGS